jgi:hypothetical protein
MNPRAQKTTAWVLAVICWVALLILLLPPVSTGSASPASEELPPAAPASPSALTTGELVHVSTSMLIDSNMFYAIDLPQVTR